MSPRLLACALLCAAAAPVVAGTLIEGRDESGNHRILIEGAWARMEYGDDVPPEYLLLNLETHEAYAVDRVRRRAVRLHDDDAARPAPPAPAAGARFDRKGSGPAIAGYATERYALRAGRQLCGEHDVAAKTLESKDIRRFIDAMRVFSQQQTATADRPVRDACAHAETVADAGYATLGLPLRVTDRHGAVQHEVRRIRAGISFPAGTFGVPKDYTVTTPRALMEQLKREFTEQAPPPQPPMDAATVKRLREQQMREHAPELRRIQPETAR